MKSLGKIIDLTRTIEENMPVYPGTEGPRLNIANTYERDGFKETRLSMYSHTGTHMDAPSHIFPGNTCLTSMPVERFCGTGLVIDCTGLCEGQRITMAEIRSMGEKAEKAEFLLFHTGWDVFWGSDRYFGSYPYMTKEVAEHISRSKKGVGFDVMGADPVSDPNLTIHRILLSQSNVVIIENLANLAMVGSELFTFFALPLKYDNADGAPVRAIAVI